MVMNNHFHAQKQSENRRRPGLSAWLDVQVTMPTESIILSAKYFDVMLAVYVV